MAGVYLVDVVGDGDPAGGRLSAFRANVPRALSYVPMMVDTARRRALIVTATDDLTGAGLVVPLLAANSIAELRTAARGNLTGQRRTTVFTALRAAGWDTPAGTTWLAVINGFARRIEPAADLDLVHVG